MKKILLFIAALMLLINANAQLGNPPTDDNSTLSYWYNVATDTWVTDRSPEYDQAFTFALEITDPEMLSYLAVAPHTIEDNTVGIALWTENNSQIDFRLQNIKGNIYGMDIILSQMPWRNGTGDITFEQIYYTVIPTWWNFAPGWYFENRIDYVTTLKTAPHTGDYTAPLGSTSTGVAGVSAPGTIVSEGWFTSTSSWKIENNTLTIRGIGAILDNNNPWYYYQSQIINIVIEDSIIGIGNSVFANYTSLTSLSLPESLTSIGNSAFANCTALTSVTLPESLTSIGTSAFVGCTALSGDLVIPEQIVSIPDNAFYNCARLNSVTIPETVTSIGSNAFGGSNASTINYNAVSCTTIGSVFGNNPALTAVTIGNTVKSIPANIFQNCTALTTVNLPASLETIGAAAFSGCTALSGDLVIPEQIVSIPDNAFYNCAGLNSVTIPETVTSIGSNAFGGSNASTINYNAVSCTTIGSVFGNNPALTAVTIGNTVKSIPANIFQNCTSLTTVNLPASLETIGAAAFSGCTALSGDLVIPTFVTTIPDNTFYNCSSLNSVTVHETVTSIGNNAFGGSNAKTVNLNAVNVTGTGSAFGNNPNLTTINIGDNVRTVPANAFQSCTGLLSVIIPDKVTTVGANAFSGCINLTFASVGKKVTSIGDRAFYNCSKLLTLSLGESLSSIGTESFGGCVKINSITCHSFTPPACNTNTFGNASQSMTVYTLADLHYPAGATYETAFVWREFENAITFGEAPEPVEVTPADTTADIVWTPVENALVYTLIIYRDANRMEPLLFIDFDEWGHFIGITMYASRSVQPTAVVPGFNFKVNNLASNTTYYYNMTAYNDENEVIDQQRGSFKTAAEGIGSGIVSPVSERSQIVGYYSILGQKLPKEPESGVYIIVYDNGKAEKVLK
ncbi:MAG: leucine-rich repeat domain-containing protein [Prevotellaceae bacterium]|jgi:hypothetical protein|nr:leucine-rich repeat domain-containing protein [Prevotellaceae bacterium]